MLIDAGFETRTIFGSDSTIWPDAIRTAIETIQTAPFLTRQKNVDILYFRLLDSRG